MKKVLVSLVVLTALVSSVFGELKFYERIGGIPQTDLYFMIGSEPEVFIDISGLNPNYRARITKNPSFQKVDWKVVKEGTKIANSGITSYTKIAYAPANADLYCLKKDDKEIFIDINTVPVESRNKILENKDIRRVGASTVTKEFDEEKYTTIEKKITSELDKLLGTDPADLRKSSNLKANNAIIAYENAKNKNFGILMNAINSELQRVMSTGDLKKTNDIKYMKELVESGKFDESSLSNGVLRNYKEYTAKMVAEVKILSVVLKEAAISETKNGNLTEAQKITDYLGGIDSKFVVSETKNVSSTGAWIVIFKSDDPSIWNTDYSGEKGFAMKVDRVVNPITKLKMKRMDTGEEIVISVKNEQLLGCTTDNDGMQWRGDKFFGWNAYHVGIYSKTYVSNKGGDVVLCFEKNLTRSSGFGFGTISHCGDKQGYAWKGKSIQKTVFSISVQ